MPLGMNIKEHDVISRPTGGCDESYYVHEIVTSEKLGKLYVVSELVADKLEKRDPFLVGVEWWTSMYIRYSGPEADVRIDELRPYKMDKLAVLVRYGITDGGLRE